MTTAVEQQVVRRRFLPGLSSARGYLANIRTPIAALLSGARKSNKSVEMEACIFKPDRLGDFVLALGAIRLLLEEFGEDRCVLVVSPFASELAGLEFPRTPRIVVPAFGGEFLFQAVRPWFHTRTVLGRYGFKRLICLRHHRLLFHDLVLTWIRAGKSYGVSGGMMAVVPKEAALFSTRFSSDIGFPATAQPGFSRDLEAHLLTCEAALGRKVVREHIMPVIRHIAQSEGDGLLVSPFSSSDLRGYPLDKLVTAISNVHLQQNFPVRVCVSRLDVDRGTKFVELLRRSGAANSELVVTESVAEYVRAVMGARIIFTVETATAHIATALDKPALVIIGGAHYGFFGPWSKSGKQIWLTNHLDCFGCDWNCIHSTVRCICDVPEDSVSRALQSLCLPSEVSQAC